MTVDPSPVERLAERIDLRAQSPRREVAVGDQTLQPGETANRIPAGSDIAFTVTVANQGENDEEDVEVTIRIRGDGGRPITAKRRIDQTTAGPVATLSASAVLEGGGYGASNEIRGIEHHQVRGVVCDDQFGAQRPGVLELGSYP